MNKQMFIDRRKRLFDQMNVNQSAIIFAASENHGYFPFLQDNNFLYLTGLNTAEAIVIVEKKGEDPKCKLFIERNIPERVVWEGEKTTKEEAQKITGIEN